MLYYDVYRGIVFSFPRTDCVVCSQRLELSYLDFSLELAFIRLSTLSKQVKTCLLEKTRDNPMEDCI